MKSPELSIIVPTYNSQKVIEECLISIINQTYKNFEVIVIDGVSSDHTLEIVRKYQEEYNYIKLYSEKDKGIYDAMNKGIEKASGTWCLFLGSDDTLKDEKSIK